MKKLRLFYIFGLVTMISFLAMAIKPAAGAGIISDIRISNLNEIGSATVSWITDEPSTASVWYKTQDEEFKEAADSRISTIHYVKIKGLTPDTAYLYYITYGGTADTNQGSYYSFLTFPYGAPKLPGNDLTITKIESAGGSSSDEALLFLSAQQNGSMESCLVSARITKGNSWTYVLGNMLTSEGFPYLWQEGLDTLSIEVDGVDESISLEVPFESGLTVIAAIQLEKPPGENDYDHDGYSENEGDCNDEDITINPAASEICDGKDNDCDGLIDSEDPDLALPATSCGVGACASIGETTCINGVLGDTCVAGTPTDEICDGEDNDCDGQIDEDLTRSCETACGPGTETCVNGAWGSCDAAQPDPEICDGEDNDCDGQIDEDLTRSCETACGPGTETCVNGTWGSCDAPKPAEEICDGKDNDCDGQIDEDLTRVCDNDCGLGMETCVNGTWANCTAQQPEPEVCDGYDNDCDGQTDEDLARSCVSICGQGEEICVNGNWVNCDAPQPELEVCDGYDNDCDGQIDEDLTRSCETDCCGAGIQTCIDGEWGMCEEIGDYLFKLIITSDSGEELVIGATDVASASEAAGNCFSLIKNNLKYSEDIRVAGPEVIEWNFAVCNNFANKMVTIEWEWDTESLSDTEYLQLFKWNTNYASNLLVDDMKAKSFYTGSYVNLQIFTIRYTKEKPIPPPPIPWIPSWGGTSSTLKPIKPSQGGSTWKSPQQTTPWWKSSTWIPSPSPIQWDTLKW